MSRYISQVAMREVGELPLTISTSIPIEEISKEDVSIVEYKSIWINIRTLIRNLHSSLETTLKKSVFADDLLPTLVEEILFLQTYLTDMGLQTHFYFSDYSKLNKLLPYMTAKEIKTPLQKQYVSIEEQAVMGLLINGNLPDIKKFTSGIQSPREKALIITHSAVDLLSYKQFSKLSLLESHTGKIKNKSEWGSKLTGGKQLTRIPFNKVTLQIFGDGNLYVAPMSIKVKRVVLELAEDHKWTPLTTADKMRFGITNLSDMYYRELLLNLLRS